MHTHAHTEGRMGGETKGQRDKGAEGQRGRGVEGLREWNASTASKSSHSEQVSALQLVF